VQKAVLEERQLRILQSLFGEPSGRDLNIYTQNSFYRPGLEEVLKAGYVTRNPDQKYLLTDKGKETIEQVLIQKLRESGALPR